MVPFRDMAYWYAFDVMGMFMLSESFDMISSSESHWAVNNLRRAMKILGPCQMTPWLAQIGFKYLKGYWLVRDWHSTVNWCRERLQDRIKVSLSLQPDQQGLRLIYCHLARTTTEPQTSLLT